MAGSRQEHAVLRRVHVHRAGDLVGEPEHRQKTDSLRPGAPDHGGLAAFARGAEQRSPVLARLSDMLSEARGQVDDLFRRLLEGQHGSFARPPRLGGDEDVLFVERQLEFASA